MLARNKIREYHDTQSHGKKFSTNTFPHYLRPQASWLFAWFQTKWQHQRRQTRVLGILLSETLGDKLSMIQFLFTLLSLIPIECSLSMAYSLTGFKDRVSSLFKTSCAKDNSMLRVTPHLATKNTPVCRI